MGFNNILELKESMKKLKVRINLIDKDKILKLRGAYDPENRTAEAKRSPFDKVPIKFQVDPSHIYWEGRRRVVFVDNATRSSRAIHTDAPIDQSTANKLNFLIEPAFWKAIVEKRKISMGTALALLMAGVGVYTFIVLILRVAGVNV